jgi:hypothetical protein
MFLNLRQRFGERDAATITAEEAQEWADALTSDERSPHVVHEVWLKAAKVIFRWGVARKRLLSSPFDTVSIAVPNRPPKLREREFNESEWRTILLASLDPLTMQRLAVMAFRRDASFIERCGTCLRDGRLGTCLGFTGAERPSSSDRRRQEDTRR